MKRILIAITLLIMVGSLGVQGQTPTSEYVYNGSVSLAKRVEVSGIAMTFGRWAGGLVPTKGSQSYLVNGGSKTDKWDSKNYKFSLTVDSYGTKNDAYNLAPDGFNAGNKGPAATAGQDGYDECPNDDTGGIYDRGGWSGAVETHTTFDIPCRGGYVYFEPTQNGTLAVYMLQNGCVDIYDKKTTVENNFYPYSNIEHPAHSPKGYVTWRPIFITDETGEEVEGVTVAGGAPHQRTWSELVSYIQRDGNDQGNNYIRWRESPHVNRLYRNWITNGQYTDDGVWQAGQSTDEGTPWKAKYAPSAPVKVPANLGGGYIVVEKGYVKYTFPVKAGKVYFIFSNSTKIGVQGFRFYADANQPTERIEIGNSQQGLTFTKGAQYQRVTLKGRTFTKGVWTSLCLPFSVSIQQLRDKLGGIQGGSDEVETVHFNQIKRESGDNIVYFDRHVYDQMIVAGVPVFIKPGKTVTDLYFNNVTIDAPEPKNVYSEQMGYTFKGVYGSEVMGDYSYFINDKLYWLKDKGKTMQSNSMRAYLKSSASDGTLAKPISGITFDVAFDETVGQQVATSVEELILNHDKANGSRFDVYTLSGVKVAHQVSSLEGLPKGIYLAEW